MKKNLISRLNEGPVIFAEGYLFAMERRGYLSAGAFVPEVVLEHPNVVTQLHREFIRAGSDVVQAFTYYGHREKLRIIGKEHLLEPMQKNALQIAKDAAKEFKNLDLMVCGDVANTNVFDPNDKSTFKQCQKMYEEQVLWAKEAGVDFIVAETINWVEEMKIALKAIKDEGLIAVANYAIPRGDLTRDGYTAGDACKIVEDLGADVVGPASGRVPEASGANQPRGFPAAGQGRCALEAKDAGSAVRHLPCRHSPSFPAKVSRWQGQPGSFPAWRAAPPCPARDRQPGLPACKPAHAPHRR